MSDPFRNNWRETVLLVCGYIVPPIVLGLILWSVFEFWGQGGAG